MVRWLSVVLATGLLAWAEIPLSVLPGAGPAERVVAAEPAEGTLQIEWKDSWETSYTANRDRWRKELEALNSEPTRRSQEYARRLIKLAHALVERYPDGGANPESNYRLLAEDLCAVTLETRTATCLGQFLAEFPGQVSLVAPVLDSVLSRLTPDSVREDPLQGELAEFASARAIALHEAGYVPAGLPLVERAYRARLTVCLAQRRYWDAAETLERFAEAAGRTEAYRQLQAELFLASGRLDLAIPLVQEIAAQPDHIAWENRLREIVKFEDTPPDFPRDLGLEMKWSAIHSRTGGADTAAVQSLLDDSAAGQGIMPSEEGRRASTWVLLDSQLLAQKPEVLAPLRQNEEPLAAEAIEQARRSGDPQAVLLACRRYPWAAASHEAMLACGELMLRRGGSGLALRMFEDVLAHAPPGEARATAQAGLWLALAGQARDPDEIQRAFEGVAPDATFPWLGEHRPRQPDVGQAASAIRQQLLETLKRSADQPAPLATADLALERLRIPPVPPWDASELRRLPDRALRAFGSPLGSLQVSGPNVLVAGPHLLAFYAEDLSKPVWWRTLNDTARKGPRRRGAGGPDAVAAPGVFQPAMAAGRVYSRWGIDPVGQCPRGIAAFNARTGEIEWSTDDDPAWDDRWPISDPVLADGRLYALAVQDKFGPILPVYLICLDAQGGALVWERALGSQNPVLPPMESSRRERAVETVRYGNAVTVHRGAVYCTTNLGFAARCDARDGMVEWIAPYPRVHLGANQPAVLRRQGSAPILSGPRAIFLPRDYQGLFALDARTGKPLWDAPLVPAEEAVGLAGQTLLVRGEDHLLAVDTASGRVVWDRPFGERMCGSALLAGGGILVATPGKALRLDLGTGAILEEKALEKLEAPSGCVLRGHSLIGVSQAAAAVETGAPPAAPGAPSAAALPLRQAWGLERPQAELCTPPAEANVPGRLYLISRGVLECLAPGPGSDIVWRRFLPPGEEELLWADRTLLLPQDRRLVALNAETGAVRWECELPFRIGARRVCPPYVAVARPSSDQPYEQAAALVDLASGRLLWTRTLRQGKRSLRILEIGWDGKDLHCLGDAGDPGEPQGVDVVVRAADGETLAVRPFPSVEGAQPRAIVLGDGFGFCLTGTQGLWEFSLADGKAVRRQVDLRDLNRGAGPSVRLCGPWLQIQQRGVVSASGALTLDAEGNPPTGKQWVLRRGDPSYLLCLDYVGEIRGDTLFVPAQRSLRAIDLASKKEVVYRVPGAGQLGPRKVILDFGRTKDRLWIACGETGEWEGAATLVRMETFDPSTGAWLEGQDIPGIFPDGGWFSRRQGRKREDTEQAPATDSHFVWTDPRIFATDPGGLHVLTAAALGVNLDKQRQPVPAIPQPVTIDGSLDEWDDRSAVPLTGRDGRTGRLYLAHDAERLYLALRYPCPAFVPHVGEGDTGTGDWMELALAASRDLRHMVLHADARGRTVCESLAGEPLSKGVKAVVRHDPARRELVYEAAFGFKQVFPQSGDFTRLGVSMTVWDEQPGAGGPSRLFTWGEGFLGRRFVPDANRHLVLGPLTPKAVETLATIEDELPDLPESFEYFLGAATVRGESPEAKLNLFAGFIQRHPQNITVERLLAFERAVRPRYLGDAGKKLLEIASKAGAPPQVCRRYELESQAYLSQWVYVNSASAYPQSVVLELDDGTVPGQPGWDHRAYWVKPYWSPWERQAHYAVQLFERFPQAKWHEIRVPLSLLKINDVPIVGISYVELGEPRLVWDRAAIVFDGKEDVLLEGALPQGCSTGGSWEWLDKPSRTGRKTHAHGAAEKQGDFHLHWCTDFAKPATSHVPPPVDGAYLSQWIYLDPKDPPKSVSLALWDGLGWRCHAIWGARSVHGRYIGPLPPAGAWQELRLPLLWTGLAGDPIAGLSFGQDGGRVYWDRTALVAGGKETVLIDDALPPLTQSAPVTWQPWVDYLRGPTYTNRPDAGKVGPCLACDGYTGGVLAPHSPALEPDELTIEAWLFLHWTPEGPDFRKWLVAKNANEETDGHYALMIKNFAVGAYLNIGGGKPNTYAAFTDQNVLELDKWNHLATTYDGRDLKVYLNGQMVAQTPANKKRTKGTGPFALASRPDGHSHSSVLLDEIRLYSRALGPEEIRDRFAADGYPPPESQARSVVAYWGFNDDVIPAEPEAGWQWVRQPARSGKIAHTQLVPDRWAGHACFFRQPALDHLPFDRQRVKAVLRQRLPDLGASEEAWRLFGRMHQVETDPNARIELCKWFVKSIPDHPHVLETLSAMTEEYQALHRGDTSFDVEARIRELNLAPATFYAYNRKYPYQARNYVRDWQLLGPLPNSDGQGHDTPYPPETEGVKLGATYDGLGGKVGWQRHGSDQTAVNLRAVFEPKRPPWAPALPPADPSFQTLAYAACWIHSDTAQKAVFELGRDDTCKIWLNRKLVYEGAGVGELTAGQYLVPVDLPAGWSEVLLKVGSLYRGWAFYFEVVDAEGRGMPKGVTIRPTPPPEKAP